MRGPQHVHPAGGRAGGRELDRHVDHHLATQFGTTKALGRHDSIQAVLEEVGHALGR